MSLQQQQRKSNHDIVVAIVISWIDDLQLL